jgi:hypothetical protein
MEVVVICSNMTLINIKDDKTNKLDTNQHKAGKCHHFVFYLYRARCCACSFTVDTVNKLSCCNGTAHLPKVIGTVVGS